MASIILDNASLTFQVRQHRCVTFKDYIVKRMFLRSLNPIMEVHALKDVDLHVKEGDRLGIVGHNGAGKSTFLKLLAGIYPPTSGKRIVDGEVSSLFDLTLGFEPDASGWENISYRGYLQGETPKSIRAKTESIAAFSELGDFLNTPVRYYSSGMRVRLAFSIATAIDPEILLVDEVLSAGDMAFQIKAGERMRQMMDRARLIVMVSHDMDSLRKFCNRAVWLDHGHIKLQGTPEQVIDAYSDAVWGTGAAKPAPAPAAAPALKLAS